MPSLLQPSLRPSELKDLFGVLLFFILLEDGGKCGIGACELYPHPLHTSPLCWSRFGTAEKHILGLLHHPLRHGDERSSGRSPSSDNRGRDDQMVPLRTIAGVAVAEEIYSGRGIISNTHRLPTRLGCLFLLSGISFFGPKKPFLPGFLRISFFSCVFQRNFSLRNSCFFSFLQDLSEIAGCAACALIHSLLPTMCLWMTALT